MISHGFTNFETTNLRIYEIVHLFLCSENVNNIQIPSFKKWNYAMSSLFNLHFVIWREREKIVKFIYSEKATKFCETSTLLMSYVVPVKSKVEISQKFVAFSEYISFN